MPESSLTSDGKNDNKFIQFGKLLERIGKVECTSLEEVDTEKMKC